MTSLIDSISSSGSETLYDPNFRIVFEDHLNYIINNQRSMIEARSVEPNVGARFAGDWRGLMIELGIFPKMHWFNLRLNGYISSSDYDGTVLSVSILNESVIKNLLATYNTRRKN